MKAILRSVLTGLVLAAPLAQAQLKWSAYDPATGGLLAGTTFEQAATFDPATNSYALSIPANSAVTFVATNIIPVDLDKPASGSATQTITFQMQASAGGFSTINKYTNFGLFHYPDGSAPSATSNNASAHTGIWMSAYNNGSTTYQTKPAACPNTAGFNFASGPDYKLASSNITQSDAGFGLGTSRATGTGLIADDTLYDVTFRVRANSAGTTQVGSSRTPDESAGGVWVDHATGGTNFHQAVYSSTTNNGFTCPNSLNEFAFYFENGSGDTVTLTLGNLSAYTGGGTAFLMGPAYFTVQPPDSITTTSGSTLTITTTPVAASVSGGPTTTYQWQVSTNDGGSYTDIDAGANASAATTTLSIDNAQSSHAGLYRLKATTSYTGPVSGAVSIVSYSSAATVSITSSALPPSIVTPPADTSVLVGGSATLTVVAGGSAPLTYQWQVSTNAGADYGDISGATSASYTIATAQLSDAGLYRVTVTNGEGSATSLPAAVTVNEVPTISVQPVGTTASVGSAVTLTVTASGTPAPTYQWRLNGATIAGATEASYTIASATGADTGNYTVVVSNSVGSVTSSTASVAVVSGSMAASATTPGNSASGLHPDARLTITFNEAVTPGVSGYVRIHDAADDSVVDTIDLVAATALRDSLRAGSTLSTQLLPVQSQPIGGIANDFHYYPVTVSGNTATIYPRNGALTYGKTYYVKVDAGAFVNAAGEAFAGINDSATWRFSTKASGPSAGATEITVAADGSGDFVTLQAALDFIPASNTTPTTIHLMNGTYFEEIGFQSKYNVSIIGENVDRTIITYPNNNTFNNVSGVYHRGVMVAQSVRDFTIANLTIINSTPQGGSQAEAIVINGSGATTAHNMVVHCKFYSYQDTVLFNKQTYIVDTMIQGDVDFMWGDGPAFFENCDIRIMRTAGYFTQIRNDATRHGFVYHNCRFTAPDGITGTFFGRIDPASFPYSEVVVLDSTIGDATNNALLATTTGVNGSSYAGGWWLLNNTSSSATATHVQNWANGNVDGTGAALADPSSEAFTEMPTDATTQANYRDPVWVLNTSIDGTSTGSWTPTLVPIVLAPPTDATVDPGDSATFTVQAVGLPAVTYQWFKDGSPISGETSATLTLATTTAGDAGTYRVEVTNSGGTAQASATLAVNAASVSIDGPGANVTAGGAVTLTASLHGVTAESYQWQLDGVDIAGATGATYMVPSMQHFNAGSYTVVVGVAGGGTMTSTSSSVAVEAPVANAARLLNISTRAVCGTNDEVLISGFVISGTGSKRVLIRTVGPELAGLGVASPMTDPTMILKQKVDGAYVDLNSNDDWEDNANAADIVTTAAAIYAFALESGSTSSALLVDLPAGEYTVVGSDKSDTSGVGIIEVYDADGDSPTAVLANISTRGLVSSGEGIMIPGFIVSEEGSKTVLVRAVGPGLDGFGVAGTLADPRISIYRRDYTGTTDELILTNDNWGENGDAAYTAQVAANVYAFALADGSADAAFVVTLPPGIYTMHASGAGDTTGVALLEVYLVE